MPNSSNRRRNAPPSLAETFATNYATIGGWITVNGNGQTTSAPSALSVEAVNTYTRVLETLVSLINACYDSHSGAQSVEEGAYYRGVLKVLENDAQKIRQAKADRVPPSPAVSSLFGLTADVPTYRAHYNIHYKRPLPAILKLRKDKILKVQKYVTRGSAWSTDNEIALQALIKKIADYPRYSREWSDCQLRIQRFRSARKSAGGTTITFHLSRGAFKAQHQASLNKSQSALKDALKDLRRKIQHERTMLRAPHHRSVFNSELGRRIAGVYTTPGLVVRRFKARKYKDLAQNKNPKTSRRHVGIELEFCAKLSTGDLAERLNEAGLANYVSLKTDGSLRVSTPGDYTHELCVLVKETNYRDVLKQVCAVLQAAGGYVNKTCGVHVHLDMRSRQAPACFQRLLKSLNILYGMVPPNRRDSRFCARNAADMLWDQRGEERYWAVNPNAYNRHRTIEVRLHSGSLNPRKLNFWVELLILISDTPNTTVFKKPSRFIEALKVPSALAAYILERTEEFDTEGVDRDKEEMPEQLPRTGRDGCDCETCREARSTIGNADVLIAEQYRDSDEAFEPEEDDIAA